MLPATVEATNALQAFYNDNLVNPLWHQRWHTPFLAFLVLRPSFQALLMEDGRIPERLVQDVSILLATAIAVLFALATSDTASLLTITIYLMIACRAWNLQADRLAQQQGFPLPPRFADLLGGCLRQAARRPFLRFFTPRSKEN
jgi:hypothetical protein